MHPKIIKGTNKNNSKLYTIKKQYINCSLNVYLNKHEKHWSHIRECNIPSISTVNILFTNSVK